MNDAHGLILATYALMGGLLVLFGYATKEIYRFSQRRRQSKINYQREIQFPDDGERRKGERRASEKERHYASVGR